MDDFSHMCWCGQDDRPYVCSLNKATASEAARGAVASRPTEMGLTTIGPSSILFSPEPILKATDATWHSTTSILQWQSHTLYQ